MRLAAAEYAFGELGLERLQVEVDPETARLRPGRGPVRLPARGRAARAAPVEGERRDVAVYGMRGDDPRPDTVTGWTALMDSVLPKKRVIAHVVVRDTAGRVLLCQVSYKKDLELPGGVVEPDEDPATGASREMQEELGRRSRCSAYSRSTGCRAGRAGATPSRSCTTAAYTTRP